MRVREIIQVGDLCSAIHGTTGRVYSAAVIQSDDDEYLDYFVLEASALLGPYGPNCGDGVSLRLLVSVDQNADRGFQEVYHLPIDRLGSLTGAGVPVVRVA